MRNNNLFDDLEDKEIEDLMKYSIPFSEDNGVNIKNKFAQKAKIKQKKFPLKKKIISVAIASTFLVSTLVYARVLDFSKIYKIVFGDNSEYVEQYIKPFVSESEATPNEKEVQTVIENTVTPNEKEVQTVIQSEYDGIVVKLISAINDGDVLRVFATMQDTTGNRLSDTIDFSSWGLSQGHGGNARVVDYDSETKTATILITSLGGDHEGNATLSINGFTTNREFKSGLKENKIDLYQLLQDYIPSTMTQEEVFVNGGAFQSEEGEALARNSHLLKFDEKGIKFDNVDYSSISNIGFVDGHLHIQTKTLFDDVDQDQVISIDFVNAKNEVVYNGHLALFYTDLENRISNQEGIEPHNQYREMIYEGITRLEQLKDLSMTIESMEIGKVTEGNWEFSFKIPEKVATEFNIDHEMNINDKMIKVDAVLLSPLGITLNLSENIASDYAHKDSAHVMYNDGTIIELNQVSIGGYEDISTLNFGGNIVEIEKVQCIIINDETIVIK